MKLHEHQANRIFADAGIPMAEGYVIDGPEGIKEFSSTIVLKSQVLTGGRGKAGGIKLVSNMDEARRTATELLGSDIRGHKVERLFIQEAVELLDQYYLGITLDRSQKRAVILFSAAGGVDIEEAARGEGMIRICIDPERGLDARAFEDEIARHVKEQAPGIAAIAEKLYGVFVSNDATMAEINPLVRTPAGLLGVDSKMTLDDNALFRQKGAADDAPGGQLTDIEEAARKRGLAYVELEGDIAVIGCGAGLVMASLDALSEYGGSPANFCDVGGGASEENMEAAIDVTLKKEGVRSLFINMFAGITRCDDIARAIIAMSPDIPMSIRMMGTKDEEGKRLLADAGYSVFDSMEEAAKAAVEAGR